MIKIMFVCHGNICRSPMAEFVFKDMIEKNHMSNQFCVSSSATSTEEIGNPVHYGTRNILSKYGISCDGKYAVQLKADDYKKYDYIIGMDSFNIKNIMRIIGNDDKKKVFRLLDFTDCPSDIADPWYTGNFEETYSDILKGCNALMKELRDIRYGSIDRADYYYESALKIYGKSASQLTDKDVREIYLMGSNHIGFFLSWIIKNNFESSLHKDSEGCKAVKDEKITGAEFLMDYCDGKFWGEDLCDEIFSFVHYYYNSDRYLKEYTSWVVNELCDIPCEFTGTWEDYHEFEHIIDEAYRNFNA